MFSSIFTNSKHTESSGSKVFDDKGDEVSKRPQVQTKPMAVPVKPRGILSIFKSTK